MDILHIWYKAFQYTSLSFLKTHFIDILSAFTFNSGCTGLLWCITWFAIVRETPSQDKYISAQELHYLSTTVVQTKKIKVIPFLTSRPIQIIQNSLHAFFGNAVLGNSLAFNFHFVAGVGHHRVLFCRKLHILSTDDSVARLFER